MGNWRIIIEGTGCHHNGVRGAEVGDANLLAEDLVRTLRAKGHCIYDAMTAFELTGTPGGRAYKSESLDDPPRAK